MFTSAQTQMKTLSRDAGYGMLLVIAICKRGRDGGMQ